MKDLTTLQERMNRIFSESVRRIKEMAEPEEEKGWSPPVDMFELPDRFVLLVELPGVPKDAVKVEIQGAALVIQGERPAAEEAGEGQLFRSERKYGAFERAFNLPITVDSAAVHARMADGVLKITIDKPEADSASVSVSID